MDEHQMTPEEDELHLLRWFYFVINNCDIVEDTKSQLYDEGEYQLHADLVIVVSVLLGYLVYY